MHRWHVQEFQVLRVLQPPLRMTAQTDCNSRGRKDFTCREFSWAKEKRKTAYWRMQGDLETDDPLGQGGEWGFIAYLHCLRAEMPFRCKQAFLREEKCLLDHLLPCGTSCSPSFSPSKPLESHLQFIIFHMYMVTWFMAICSTFLTIFNSNKWLLSVYSMQSLYEQFIFELLKLLLSITKE
jgi:hypothetical protein